MEFLLDKYQNFFTGAVIGGSDGIIWYFTPGFYPDSNEFKNMLNVFEVDTKKLYSGIIFQDLLYSIIYLDQNSMIAECDGGYSLYLLKNQNIFVFTYENQKILRESCQKACHDIMNFILENNL